MVKKISIQDAKGVQGLATVSLLDKPSGRQQMVGWLVKTSRGVGRIAAFEKRDDGGWKVRVAVPIAKKGWPFDAEKVFLL